MNVDAIQMSQLVGNAMPYINRAVNRYVNRCPSLRQSMREDFVSVCTLAVIEHIHAAQDEEKARLISPMMLLNAISRYELSTLPVSVPCCTARYKQYIQQSQAAMQQISRQAASMEDDMRLMEVHSFADTLPDEQQAVLSLLLRGCTLQETANRMGRSVGWVCKVRNAIRLTWQNES